MVRGMRKDARMTMLLGVEVEVEVGWIGIQSMRMIVVQECGRTAVS